MESLLAGAMAGLVVDLTLYPIDTIKTRTQSKRGFYASGGFSEIYKGLSAVAIGSVPAGAAFFYTYDMIKKLGTGIFSSSSSILGNNIISSYNKGDNNAIVLTNDSNKEQTQSKLCVQSLAAICGETAACSIRVPVEMVKQRMQAGHYCSVWTALCHITNGSIVNAFESSKVSSCNSHITPVTHISWKGISHLFSGMPIMLLREWPFSIVQMCLYEELKVKVQKIIKSESYIFWTLPLCGAISGGCAAFVTTPLDVIKTRIMLQSEWPHSQHLVKYQVFKRIHDAFIDILHEPCRINDRFGTVQKFFRGATARVLWISLGGGVFFSTYEFFKHQFKFY